MQIIDVVKTVEGGQTWYRVISGPYDSQEAAVIKKALDAGGIPAESISYIEAHGTGTSLGDPIEVQGLKQAFKGVNTDIAQCALGTTKAHIGHAEGAAGIAGLIKVILAMKNKTIPAMPHLEEINPYINMEGSPLYINRQNDQIKLKIIDKLVLHIYYLT